MSSPPPGPAIPLFRPSKKRKLYRARPSTDDQLPSPTMPTTTTSSPPPPLTAQSLDELIATSSTIPTPNVPTDEEPSIAALLRQRQQRRPRAGVGFSAAGVRDGGNGVREEDGKVVVVEGEVVRGVERKFAPQMGAVGDVNKHMMAFIDSRLAHSHSTTHDPPNPPKTTHQHPVKSVPIPESHRAPATLGRLQEIDLGDEARSRNEAQTDLARRRLDGEDDADETGENGKKKNAKVRLGPDGKPWRGRKRRGSDDVKRDKMVEDVLRENRLEIYEPPPSPPPISDDQAADDRIAEAFRREFMDAVSQRQRAPQVQQVPVARGAGGKKEEELKGPKLGGSRSARAAMREMMLKGGKK